MRRESGAITRYHEHELVPPQTRMIDDRIVTRGPRAQTIRIVQLHDVERSVRVGFLAVGQKGPYVAHEHVGLGVGLKLVQQSREIVAHDQSLELIVHSSVSVVVADVEEESAVGRVGASGDELVPVLGVGPDVLVATEEGILGLERYETREVAWACEVDLLAQSKTHVHRDDGEKVAGGLEAVLDVEIADRVENGRHEKAAEFEAALFTFGHETCRVRSTHPECADFGAELRGALEFGIEFELFINTL